MKNMLFVSLVRLMSEVGSVKYIITVAAHAAVVSFLYSLSTAEAHRASVGALPTI